MPVTKRRSNSKKNLKSKKSKNSKSRKQYTNKNLKGGSRLVRNRQVSSLGYNTSTMTNSQINSAWNNENRKGRFKSNSNSNSYSNSNYSGYASRRGLNNSSASRRGLGNSSGYSSGSVGLSSNNNRPSSARDNASFSASASVSATTQKPWWIEEESRKLTREKAKWLADTLYDDSTSEEKKIKNIYDMLIYRQHQLYRQLYDKYGKSENPRKDFKRNSDEARMKADAEKAARDKAMRKYEEKAKRKKPFGFGYTQK